MRVLLTRVLNRLLPRPPQAIYLGDHTVLLRTSHGYRLYVDSRDISLAPHLIMDGIWEPAVTALLNARVRHGMRAIDVGANVGYHSLHLAHLVGEQGRLVCFEANAALARLLVRSLEINGFRNRARAHAKAASDSIGECDFSVFDRHLGASSFRVGETTAEEFHDRVSVVRVETTTLDAACADLGPVDFMKIDAEGAESAVIAGAQTLIANSPNLEILMEFYRGFFPTPDETRAFFGRFTQQGFTLRKLSAEGTLSPTSLDALLASDALEELLLSRRDD